MALLDSMSSTSLEGSVKDLVDMEVSHTFPVPPHCTSGFTRQCRQSSLPSEPTALLLSPPECPRHAATDVTIMSLWPKVFRYQVQL